MYTVSNDKWKSLRGKHLAQTVLQNIGAEYLASNWLPHGNAHRREVILFVLSTSTAQVVCYYMEALLNTATLVTVLATQRTHDVSHCKHHHIEVFSRQNIRAESFISYSVPCGKAYCEQVEWLSFLRGLYDNCRTLEKPSWELVQSWRYLHNKILTCRQPL